MRILWAVILASSVSLSGVAYGESPATLGLSGGIHEGLPVALKFRFPITEIGPVSLGFKSTILECYQFEHGFEANYPDGTSARSIDESGSYYASGLGAFASWKWSDRFDASLTGSFLVAMPGAFIYRAEFDAGTVVWDRIRLEVGPFYSYSPWADVRNDLDGARNDEFIKGLNGPGIQFQVGMDLGNKTVPQVLRNGFLTFTNAGLLAILGLVFINSKIG